MKHMRKVFALALTLIMALALTVPAFAQDVDTGKKTGGASITISNAAKGETYTIYKLFDASVTGTEGGSIAYTGTIPASLADYFKRDTAGNITAKAAAWKDAATKVEMSDGLRTALATWAETATKTADAVSDGSALIFKNLEYGYYVVTTTQGESAITVDSTNPNASIVDKNSTAPGTNLSKSVNDDDVNIGDTVTYTVTFKTANYDGAGTAAKKIVSYTIADTLPEFLSDVTVTSIIVDNDGDASTTDDQTNVTAQFVQKQITIDWYDESNSQFRYDNGATVTITYTAVVTDKVAIAGEGNTNTVTLTWTTDDGSTGGGETHKETATIYSYAIALKKVNDKGEALAGAEFKFPFYVKSTPDTTDGAYIYAGTTAAEGLTDTLTTPADGVIVVKGVATATYSITETKAPDGYNKLTDPVDVPAVKTNATTTNVTVYLDANGNETASETETKVQVVNNDIAASVKVVVNKTGAELPSTGGIGTTIFYMVGGILMAGAAILLITKKKMSNEQ